MQKTLAEIAHILDGEVHGDGSIEITGLNGIREAIEGDITFVANSKYAALIKKTQASAVIIPKELDLPAIPSISVQDPVDAFSKLAQKIVGDDQYLISGIHPSAVISEGVQIGDNVCIGPQVVVEPGVVIGDHCRIEAGSFVGYKAQLGQGVHLYPNVTVLSKCRIGDRVRIFSGTVIGADGFGFEAVNGAHQKIPQIGIVIIEDDVEIGSNVTIDRARFHATVIGRGTKIDNLVQIGHNVIIGEHCIVVSQVGISGSTLIGKNSILAGQAGIAGHLTIGDNSIVAAQAGVTGSLPANSKVSGYPAKPHVHAKRVNAHVQNLPGYIKRIKALEKKLSEREIRPNETD